MPSTCRIQCAYHGSKPVDNRISVPIYINDMEYTALLDTGCTSTSIDPRVARELGIDTGILKNVPTILTNTKQLRSPSNASLCSAITALWNANWTP